MYVNVYSQNLRMKIYIYIACKVCSFLFLAFLVLTGFSLRTMSKTYKVQHFSILKKMSHFHNICGIYDSSLQFNLYTILEQKIEYSIFWEKNNQEPMENNSGRATVNVWAAFGKNLRKRQITFTLYQQTG